MQTLPRRTFTAWLVGLFSFPMVARGMIFPGDTKKTIEAPSRVAGHDLSDDEKALAKKFLEGYDETMAPLRERDLPNALSPSFHYASPRMIAGKGDGHDQR